MTVVQLKLIRSVVKEGLYLFQHGFHPYSSGLFHHVREAQVNLWLRVETLAATIIPVVIHDGSTSQADRITFIMDSSRCIRRVEPCSHMESA